MSRKNVRQYPGSFFLLLLKQVHSPTVLFQPPYPHEAGGLLTESRLERTGTAERPTRDKIPSLSNC